MRITIAQGAFLPVPPLMGGAVEKTWFALGREFARQGHTVAHLSRKHPGLPLTEKIDGVRHQRVAGFNAPRFLPARKVLDLLYSMRLLRQLPAADILVTHTFWLPLLLRTGAHGKVYVHVGRYPKGQMRFYRGAARLQTVSSPVGRAIAAQAPALAARVKVIPYPLPENAAPKLTDRLTERAPVLLYVGRLHPEKGLELLLNAFGKICSTGLRDWRLQVVGPWQAELGGGGREFHERLRRLGNAQVEWIGPVFEPERLAGFYQRASLFAYPSLAERGETFGMAPLEAMAQGCPPLVSNLECFQDFVVDQQNGFVFDHRDHDPVQTLATKLRALMAAPEHLAAAGAQARATAAGYALPKVAAQYLADFSSLQAA